MSFYSRSPQIGFWPIVAQLVGSALQSQPLENDLPPPPPPSPVLPIVAGVVGLGIVGGLVYILVKK